MFKRNYNPFRRKSAIEKIYLRNEEFIWYSIVSIMCTVILYVLFFTVDKFTGGNYLVANFVSYTISFMVLYVLDKQVFDSKPKKGKNRITQGVVFLVVRIIGFPIDSFILHTLISYSSMDNMTAKIVCSLIMFIYNYITNKLFVFKGERF